MPNLADGQSCKVRFSFDDCNHRPIEVAQLVIAKRLVVEQVPLTPCVLVRPAVAFAGEVNPFRVPELIAHEVEVAAVASRQRDQPNHLMQSNAAIGNVILVAFAEVPIHVGINQPEDNRLVTNQRLVVALGVGNCLFICAAISHLPED